MSEFESHLGAPFIWLYMLSDENNKLETYTYVRMK